MKTMMRNEVRQLMVAAIQRRQASIIAPVVARHQSSVASARVISDDIQDGPATAVETSTESRAIGDAAEATVSSGCPMAALRQMTKKASSATAAGTTLKSMDKLNGPIGWPIVGNFLTYLKKENQGKMHEVQVWSRKCCNFDIATCHQLKCAV
jgi:uncharacterized protein YaaW (UPF0174 family)